MKETEIFKESLDKYLTKYILTYFVNSKIRYDF